jgi:hypothetical protein
MCISVQPAMVCAKATIGKGNNKRPIELQTQTHTLERGRGRGRGQQQQQGQVRFSSIMGIIVPPSNLTEEENQRVWYTSSELIMMKNEIRTLSRIIRDDHHQHGGVLLRTIRTTTNRSPSSTSDTISTRGLELRLCKNRQQNKALAIWGTLKAQNRNNDPQFIAMLSQKCTAAAKELAIAEAVRDYCEVYNPDAIPFLSPNIEAIVLCPFPVKLKRKCSTTATTKTMTLENIESNNNGISHVQTTRNVRLRTS